MVAARRRLHRARGGLDPREEDDVLRTAAPSRRRPRGRCPALPLPPLVGRGAHRPRRRGAALLDVPPRQAPAPAPTYQPPVVVVRRLVSDAPAAASFPALGTTATVAVAEPRRAPGAARARSGRSARARSICACSRFRPTPSSPRANARAGDDGRRSAPLLAALLGGSRSRPRAATGGRVDPTLGVPLRAVGLRPHVRARARARGLARSPRAPGAWPRLGAGRRARRCSRRRSACRAGSSSTSAPRRRRWPPTTPRRAIAAACGAGRARLARRRPRGCRRPPAGGWSVRIADDQRAPLDAAGPDRRRSRRAGSPRSSTAVRRWRTDAGDAHHILDPHTGRPAVTPWRTVTVAAATCFDANVAATAAIVLGDAAPRVARRSGGCRRGCVRRDGSVVRSAAGPSEVRAA